MTTPIVPSITNEQLAKLERLSDGANQSGWYWDDKTVDEDGYTFIPEGSCLVSEICLAEQYEGYQEDCNFIEAAKPAVIKSLITRLRAAEKDAARYRWLRTRAYGHFHMEDIYDLFSFNDDVIDEMVDEVMGKSK